MQDMNELIEWTKILHNENKELKRIFTEISNVAFDKGMFTLAKLDKIKELLEQVYESDSSNS